MLPAIHSYVQNSNLLCVCALVCSHPFKIDDYCVHVTLCSLEKITTIPEEPLSPIQLRILPCSVQPLWPCLS
jgi:hypothetical protein